MKRKINMMIGLLVFLCGAGFFLYPIFSGIYMDYRATKVVKEFERERENEDLKISFDNGEQSKDQKEEQQKQEQQKKENDEFYQACQEYNRQLYEEGQQNLKDAWSYEQPGFAIEKYGREDNLFGVLSIPAMEFEMPLYLGASLEHMARGAAVLGQSSLPIGGNNTNCVIACHRGYKGAPYFRKIDLLKEGDKIYITNVWETLVYQVVGIEIISPDEVDKILIQKNEDMITLLTCHPYRVGSQRYLVYCKRE